MTKRKKLEGEVGAFLRQYTRKSDPHTDPNDRRYDRKLEHQIKRMDPEELDELMHGRPEEDLEKDPRIHELLADLEQALGRGTFMIVDHWEPDLLAVGVASPKNSRVLAYLALREHDDQFDVHLELPAEPRSEVPYVDAGLHEGVGFEELVKLVRAHLIRTDLPSA